MQLKNDNSYKMLKCNPMLTVLHCNIADCGGIIDLESGQEEIITSPGWPSKYRVNLSCVWVVRVC